jgi:EamA-like transporter family.
LSPLFFLIASIVLTSWLTISFKVAERWGVSRLQAIVFNYIVCVITGSIVNGYFPWHTGEPWFGWALVMGCCFIAIFNLAAFVVQRAGVSVATVAYKLSLVIPFVFSLYLYNEQATWFKISGVAMALAAIWFTTVAGKQNNTNKISRVLALTPLLLFITSGLLDTMIKYVEQAYIDDHNQNSYLITAFGTAALVGLVVMLGLFISRRQRFEPKAVLAGMAIGVPNYFSIWCLLGALKGYAGNSSAIIPINNMSIVLFSALVAWLIFREKLTSLNWLGVGLSIGAIALIAFG